MIVYSPTSLKYIVTMAFAFLFFACVPASSLAATLSVSPATGVYKTGATFTVSVYVNTAGKAVNAADGTLSFNPSELSVVAASRGSSIFNLWTTEPTFSNAAGTVTFSGGLPSAYTGASGNVMTVTFRSLTSGAARISLTGASVLAADGKGTNVLTNMSGGTYTMSAVESQPAPEVIVEYVAPANTPAAPTLTSPTHADQSVWSKDKKATINWSLPAGVTAVRTSLDSSPVSVPIKVYDTPIKTLTIESLDEGVSYLHIQLKNEDGWGKVSHYKFSIDSQKPESFEIVQAENNDLSNPNQVLSLNIVDKGSTVRKFKVVLDGGEPFDFIATTSTSSLSLPTVKPGSHTVVIEGFDAAGNSLIATYSFTVSSFEKPLITEFPSELSSGVAPVIRGTTKANAVVEAELLSPSGEISKLKVTADGAGVFTIIPEKPFSTGVYKLSVTATDIYGAMSERSDEISMTVSVAGYMVVGSFLISFLSVLIPLIALCVLTWIVLVYSVRKMGLLKRRVLAESEEATFMLEKEFAHIESVLHEQMDIIASGRKTNKLTKAENQLYSELSTAVEEAKARVGKEVSDVTKVIKK